MRIHVYLGLQRQIGNTKPLNIVCSAGVVKLVYTTDSKSVAFGRGGSSPPTGTTYSKKPLSEMNGAFFVPALKQYDTDQI